MDRALAWIEQLQLQPIPEEGGWFRRVGEGGLQEDGKHVSWSSILALFTREGFSAMHRLAIDEIWIHQAGDPLEMLLLRPEGEGKAPSAIVRLGLNIAVGEQPQVRVPAGIWQGARPVGDRGWALVSCVCVPGFLPEDFEIGSRAQLLKAYPESREALTRLTRG